MLSQGFETSSVRMEPYFIVSVQAPEEDVERIMEHVTRVAPLVMGKYDSNAFQSAAGIERYRPLTGAAAGAENEVRKRPGVVELTFQIPKEHLLLQELIETVFQVHSYEEPVIVVREALASRSKGLDDKNNPYRWWNATGDWKKAKQPNE
jgi:hypothetical protein